MNGLFLVSLITVCLSPGETVGSGDVIILEEPVRVITSSSPEIFPEAWRKPSVSPEGGVLPGNQIERARAILSKALAKYPTDLLEAELKAVYVLSELRYRGVVTSGTNSSTGVYLKVGPDNTRYTDPYIEGTFHAEFSSILIRNHADLLDKEAWQQANPPDFTYLGDGVEAVKQGKARRSYEESLLEQGFLTEYGSSTLENDFNGMALRLFTGEAQVWKLADQYPRIKTKLDLALAFYLKLDPSFTEAFFRSLVKIE